MKTSKRKSKIENNTFLGLLMLIAVNVLFCSTAILVSRFIKIYPKYFVLGIAILLALVLLINLVFVVGYVKKIAVFRKIMLGLSAFLVLITGVATYYLYRTNSLIDQMIDLDGQENVEYVLLSVDPSNSLEDAFEASVGYIQGSDNYESFLIEQMEPLNLNVDLVLYSGLSDMISAIADGNLNYIVLPRNYRKLTESLDQDNNPLKNAVVLANFNTQQDEDLSNIDVSKEPFTILLMGVNEGLSDSNIVASYNPATQRVTMTSIPRDSFVPIACQAGRRDKMNHARAISRQCFIDTVENYIDTNIDFYFEADFYAVVKIVDALGGLEITSPVAFAGTLLSEDGTTPEAIHVPKGTNMLNGKQVLTFARERYHMPNGDFDRQMNQQYVIKQIVSKVISTRNPNKIIEVLNAAKNNISTNLSLDSITALMGHAFEVIGTSPLGFMDAFRIESTQILGEGSILNSGMWVMWPYINDITNTTALIELNLNPNTSFKEIKQFTFAYQNPYKYTRDSNYFKLNHGNLWIGDYVDPLPETEEPTEEPEENGDVTLVVVPDFSVMTNDEALAWGNENSVTITFGYHETSQPDFVEGQFWYQSAEAGAEIYPGGSIHIVRVKLIDGSLTPEETQPGTEDNQSNSNNGDTESNNSGDE